MGSRGGILWTVENLENPTEGDCFYWVKNYQLLNQNAAACNYLVIHAEQV